MLPVASLQQLFPRHVVENTTPIHCAGFCQNQAMRLTLNQQQIIREASVKRFGVSARLFGSRVDDDKRGGDIDLYIEASLSPGQAFKCETRLAADLYLQLGERKIDIVVNTGALDLPIYKVARAQGVWL